jgi:hypothetical protein
MQLHAFISSALYGVNGQLHLEIRNLVGSSDSMDIIEKKNNLTPAGN